MSNISGSSSSGAYGSREHIIPIHVERDEQTPKTRTNHTPKLFSSKREEQPAFVQSELEKTPINSAENSREEICNSVKSLSLAEEQLQGEFSNVASLAEIDVSIPQRTLPSSNVPERIIIALDRALDENCTKFELPSGKKYSPLFMLHHALKIFLHNKAAIDNQHEFALMLLNEDTASWVHDFTNSPHDILHMMQTVSECEPEDIFNLNKVFDLINKKVELCIPQNDLLVPPSYMVRIILLYGRSYSIPHLNRTKEIEKLLGSPYFTVDVVMTHEPPSSANHCDKIFKALQEVDTKGYGYSFSVSRNASDLHIAMAKILSHPLQRSHQLSAKYNISSFI